MGSVPVDSRVTCALLLSCVNLAAADENTLSKLNVNLTCEPRYESQKLYHG